MRLKIIKKAGPNPVRLWHSRFLWLPKKITLAGKGTQIFWLERMDARFSKSTGKWHWREPGEPCRTAILFAACEDRTVQAIQTPRPPAKAVPSLNETPQQGLSQAQRRGLSRSVGLGPPGQSTALRLGQSRVEHAAI